MTREEDHTKARPSNDQHARSIQCALDVFEGRRIPRVFIRGDWYFPARLIGRFIEQEDDAKQFVRGVTEDGTDGIDYIRTTSEEQAQVRHALRESEGGIFYPSQNHSAFSDGSGRGMVLLSESGLYLALVRSRKAIGKRMRLWLARDVIPAIRKTGAYVAPNANDAVIIELRNRVAALEAGNANGGVIGSRFARQEFEERLKYAANLLSAARGKTFNSTYRSLRNKFEREMQYGKRGQKWSAFPANPERVSDALAFVNRTVQDAEREHRTWVDTRPSPQMHFDLFAA